MPVPVQKLLSIAGSVIALLSAVFMLKGANWARWIFIIWGAVGALCGLINVGFALLLLPSLIIYVASATLLMQKEISDFFTRHPESPSAPIDVDPSKLSESEMELYRKGVCPMCKEKINRDYTKCFSCGFDFNENNLMDM